jgi:hypothetical protein
MTTRDELVRLYGDSPIMRALAELLPGGGALNELMAHRAAEIDRERLKTLLDEIAAGARPLTQETIASEDFLHCFFATIRASRLTRQRQKIRLLGRLLTASFDPTAPPAVDRFERYLGILDEMTFEEIQLLSIVSKHEKAADPEGNPVQRTNRYWSALKAEASASLGLPEASIEPLLTRLSRTGLYQPITGAYLDYEGGRGMLTPLYEELATLISTERFKV